MCVWPQLPPPVSPPNSYSLWCGRGSCYGSKLFSRGVLSTSQQWQKEVNSRMFQPRKSSSVTKLLTSFCHCYVKCSIYLEWIAVVHYVVQPWVHFECSVVSHSLCSISSSHPSFHGCYCCKCVYCLVPVCHNSGQQGLVRDCALVQAAIGCTMRMTCNHAATTPCNLHWWCFPQPTRHLLMCPHVMYRNEHVLQFGLCGGDCKICSGDFM